MDLLSGTYWSCLFYCLERTQPLWKEKTKCNIPLVNHCVLPSLNMAMKVKTLSISYVHVSFGSCDEGLTLLTSPGRCIPYKVCTHDLCTVRLASAPIACRGGRTWEQDYITMVATLQLCKCQSGTQTSLQTGKRELGSRLCAYLIWCVLYKGHMCILYLIWYALYKGHVCISLHCVHPTGVACCLIRNEQYRGCVCVPDIACTLQGSCFRRKWSRLSHPPPTLTMTRSLSS